MNCERCAKATDVIAPVMSEAPRHRVLDDIMDPNRHLPRSALTNEQNAAIPYGTHPDDFMFEAWCMACVRQMKAEHA